MPYTVIISRPVSPHAVVGSEICAFSARGRIWLLPGVGWRNQETDGVACGEIGRRGRFRLALKKKKKTQWDERSNVYRIRGRRVVPSRRAQSIGPTERLVGVVPRAHCPTLIRPDVNRTWKRSTPRPTRTALLVYGINNYTRVRVYVYVERETVFIVTAHRPQPPSPPPPPPRPRTVRRRCHVRLRRPTARYVGDGGRGAMFCVDGDRVLMWPGLGPSKIFDTLPEHKLSVN